MDYIGIHALGAPDGGVFGPAAPPQGCQCGGTHYRPHSAHGDGKIPATPGASVRASWKCASTVGRDTGSIMCIAEPRLCSCYAAAINARNSGDIKRAQKLGETLCG